MSPIEVCWRIRRLLWQVYAKRMHRRWHARYMAHRSEHAKAIGALDAVRFYGLNGLEVGDMPPAWRSSAVEAADRLLRHRFRYLGLGEIDLGPAIRWNHEYKRRADTPLVFGPWMDYSDSDAYGDFKYFWETPRLQHLILLAKAYYLTGESKHADEVLRQLRQFADESPYLLGVNWTVPMEAGVRLVSRCWITFFLRSHLRARPEGLDLIEGMVRANMDYVTRNYARYSSANNHLVGEAAGVFTAAVCFGHLRGMRRHRDRACKILCTEIQQQHFPDGVNKEQAVHYQVFATHFFLLAGLLGRANEVDFPTDYWRMLEKSVGFIAALMDGEGRLPHIGDSDDGRAVVLSDLTGGDAVTLVATSAVAFRNRGFSEKVRQLDEASFWLVGKAGMEAFRQLPDREQTSGLPRRFDQGGYYILKGWTRPQMEIIFDCGPLGLSPMAAHGHADALSFVLRVDGRPFLIDTGTYTYDRRDPLRNYFRSTAAHNTVAIDGQDQSEMIGPFLWGRKTVAHLEEYIEDERRAKVTGRHDGYKRLADPVVHRRSIELDKENGIIRIHDELLSSGPHEVASYFHVSPECDVDLVEGNHLRVKNADTAIGFVVDKTLTCEVVRGRDDPPAGWASFAYDQKVPANTIVCKGAFRGDGRFETEIRAV
jgi:hypothetical protein